jgi:hypothetical protein
VSEKGSAEWLNECGARISEEAHPQLEAIAGAAVKRHGADRIRLDQTDIVRLASVLSEVQDQSFMLGVQLGMKLVMDLLKGQL